MATLQCVVAHINTLTFFGGAPALLVPDNPRALIRDPDRYEPIADRTYEALAEHYGCAILPVRQRKTQDKAKVEAGVLLVALVVNEGNQLISTRTLLDRPGTTTGWGAGPSKSCITQHATP